MDTQPEPGPSLPSTGSPGHVLVFTIAGQNHAVDIGSVIEILADRGATEPPRAVPGIVGVVPVRGRMVTLLDVRHSLGLADRPLSMRRQVIVVESKGDRVGLVVDAVKGVTSSADQQIPILEIDALLEGLR